MANNFIVLASVLWLVIISVIITSTNTESSDDESANCSEHGGESHEDCLNKWANKKTEPVFQENQDSDGWSDYSDNPSKVLDPNSQSETISNEVSETGTLYTLFEQFKMDGFRMKTLNETTVYLEWTINKTTNHQDSNRILHISTVKKLNTELIMNQLNTTKVTMRNEICHKYSDDFGKCNFTMTVNSCSNYQFRFGGERNTETVTTVGVDPLSLREDLSEMGNSPIKLRWKITCDSDFMTPVFVTLADMKRSTSKNEELEATCENRTCVTTTKKLRTSPCSNYSLNLDGAVLRIVNTPPTTNNLSAETIPWKYQYLLRWSITPANCQNDPMFVVSKTTSREEPVYDRLALNASSKDYCNKGFCEYAYEVEPCVTHWIKSNNPNLTHLKLLRPSVLELSNLYTGDLDNPVRLSWKVGCLSDQKHFLIALTDKNTQQRNLSNVSAECDEDSQQCNASLTKEHNELLPCNRYEVEMEGTNEMITFETPPPPTVFIRPLSSAYAMNGTLVISVAFEGIQRNCGAWKNSIELQFLDFPSKAVLSPCTTNDEDHHPPENCTLIIKLDPADIVCYPAHNVSIRPVYSRSDSLYRGSWLNTTITPMNPESWVRDGRLSDLVVKANTSQQWMKVEWRNPVCFNGSPTYPTNLTIVSSATKELVEYHLTISSQCSRLNSNPSKSSIIVHNDGITCSDGKKLSDGIKLFNMTPCTNYSLIMKPLILGDVEPLNENSAIQTTFITEFIHLVLDSLSSDNVNVSASHSTSNQWELKLGVQKKYCPCDDHIVSATFKLPSARLVEQTIPCNQGVDCHGKVEFNHLNLCQPLEVEIGLQYSKSYANQIFWFNKTLAPLVEENKSKNGTLRLQVREIGRHRLQLLWKDPVCLNGVVSSWNMEFRQEDGSLFRTLNIPYNCSATNRSKEFSKDHNVYLEAGKLVCETNWKDYDIGLPPCTQYSFILNPVVEEQSLEELLEFSQSANFISLFSPSNIADVKIVNVTSNNFELNWTIPPRCSNSFEIDVEVNGTMSNIKSSDNTLNTNIDCDEKVCRISRSINPIGVILLPCSDYTVRVGSTNLSLTTLPGDNELKISPEKISVMATIRTKNYLNLEMTFQTFDKRCSARLNAFEFQLQTVFPSIQQLLLCPLNTTNDSEPSSTICSTQIAIKRLDKCEELPFNFRPSYQDISYADKVSWTNMKLNSLLSQVEKRENKIKAPEVQVNNSDNQQTVLLNWNDPMCLLADSLSWEVRINSTTGDIHRIQIPSECSFFKKGTSFERSVWMENGQLLQCNNTKNEKDFTFLSCSSYSVTVIPVLANFESTTFEAYAQTTLLHIPFVFINPNVTKVTSNAFSLEWSFPLECKFYVEMSEISTMVKLNGIEIEINMLNLTSDCDEMNCTILWTSPHNLTSCTEYTVSAGSIIQTFSTLPDPHESHISYHSYDEDKFVPKATTAVRNSNLNLVTLIICLSMLGSILLGIIVGICFGVRKRYDQSESDERYIQRFRDIYI